MGQAISSVKTLVSMRPVSAGDEQFLAELQADSRPDLRSLGLPPVALASLLDLQRRAQRAEYDLRYPDAVDEVIEIDGRPVGRCWTALTRAELRLLDIAVLNDLRRQGIARAILARLVERAAAARGGCVPIRLMVWADNEAARRLYANAGFSEDNSADDITGYLALSLAAPYYAQCSVSVPARRKDEFNDE
ncbi:MAG: Acetyltransferase, family [Frankiales bacterium]|nr:Acetyltransferase, family [Frankiales bacterium]